MYTRPLENKTDQELADLIRENSKQLSLQQNGYFNTLKEKAKQSFRYTRECRRRGIDKLTLLKNNPAS